MSNGTSDRSLVAWEAVVALTQICLLTCLTLHSLVMKAVAQSVSAGALRIKGLSTTLFAYSRITTPVSCTLHGKNLAICIGFSDNDNTIPRNFKCNKNTPDAYQNVGIGVLSLSSCHGYRGAGQTVSVRRK